MAETEGRSVEDMKLDALEQSFAAGRESHEDLIGLPDRDLRLRAGDATHQHFKGGLYRLLGPARDAETGEQLRDSRGRPCLAYLHCYPYARDTWVRAEEEFHDGVERPGYRGPRFRRIG